MKLKDLTNKTALDLQNTLLKQKIKASTVNGIMAVYDAIIKHTNEIYNMNIHSHVKKLSVEPTKMYIMSLDQYDEMDKTNPHDDYIDLYRFLYWTGLRIGEALALQWSDIDGDYINITKSWSLHLRITTTPKTKTSVRRIKLLDTTKTLLQAKKERDSTRYGFNEDSLIFGTYKHLGETAVRSHFKTMCERLNITGMTLHDFRHSHASIMLSMGCSITVVSARLGHASIKMTFDRYVKMLPTDEEQAIDMINGKIKER